ncbi:MAG: DUF6273 domain-containing protein [Treponema sp.]|nr:DUF6273 domain-containing protein [Treponema sp.]
MSKKLFFLAPVCALLLTLASCSLFSDVSDEKGPTSVNFTIDSRTAQTLLRQAGIDLSDSTRASIGDLHGLYINLSLRGQYPISQFAPITANGVTISFANVPAGLSVYAYAEIYSDSSNVLYKGKSDNITIRQGFNNLTVKIMNATAFNTRYPDEPANTNNPAAPAPGSGGNNPGNGGNTPGSGEGGNNGGNNGGNGGDNGNGGNGGSGGGGNIATADPYGGPVQNLPDDPNWFDFQSRVAVQPEGTMGTTDELYNICTYGSEGTKYAAPTPRYVLFGNYPRTHKASSVTVDTTGESHVMGNFTYYKGSDNNWYAKFKTGRNSNYKYYAGTTPGSVDEAVESAGTEAWFKLEPIKWRVLTTNYNGTGKALLVTDEALPGYFDYDTSPNHYCFEYVYNNDYSTPNRTIGGRTIYKNNYQYSNARAWLNGMDGSGYEQQDWTNTGFINSAFTEAGRMRIAETVVDNSAVQCYYAFVNPGTDTTYNNYLSENTTDKVFLLSLNEVTNPLYGFYEYILQYGARCFIPTDLAIASNCSRDINGGYNFGCITLLRSPSNSDTGVTNCSGIGFAGDAESAYNDNNNYFTPAICIDLSATGIGKVGEGNVAADSHGLLPGAFTVDSTGKQVKFSQSNLWKNNTASDYHFVSQQYYYCEKNTERGSTEKYNYDLLDYLDATTISNITIPESDITNWRLLTADEWQYLFEGRTGASDKFGVAKILNCDGPKSAYMTGFVLLPDDWTAPTGITFTSGWMADDANFPNVATNTYNSWEWKKMEEAGAVFLPAGGYCTGSWSVEWRSAQKYHGHYWNTAQKFVNIDKNQIETYEGTYSYTPAYASIRLVQEQ